MQNFHPKDSDKKSCIFIGSECKEQFRTCEIYDEEENKTKSICQSILPFYEDKYTLDIYSKCVCSDDGQCLRKKKECSEIEDSSKCLEHLLDDNNKKCIFDNNKCKEVYKSCSDYNNIANKNEEDCKAIILYYEFGNIDYYHKCIYEDNNCKKVSKPCNDYVSGQNEDFCNNIILNQYKKCVLKDNNCVEIYKDCPGEYEANEVVNIDTCTSIEVLPDIFKCVLDKNNKCVRTKKECSEYTGSDKYGCEHDLDSLDTNKRCFMEMGKCIGKYIYCKGYKGKDTKICESIIPYDDKGNSLEFTHICYMGINGCDMKKKECKEF